MNARSEVPVIAIDGPTASGKGAVSEGVARALGWHYLDSGALYRLVGLVAIRAGASADDVPRLAELARTLDAVFEDGVVRLGEEDVGAAIRATEVGAMASRIASHGPVREALLDRQRAFRRPPGLVADGRDMGTSIFPDAQLKIFLDASPEERARRRHKQLKDKGMDVSLGRLLEEIRMRDRRDAERTVSPMRPAEGALIVDTTGMGIQEVVAKIIEAWRIAEKA